MAEKKQEENLTSRNSISNRVKDMWKSLLSTFSSNNKEEDQGPEFPNIAFYSNQILAAPLKDKLEDILDFWKADYQKLETNCFYIQWLFPNRKPGINGRASVLKDMEVQVISSTPELRGRVRRAFELMLDFYGTRLTEKNKFELTENSKERIESLNLGKYNHNNLRITRILLALKELGHKELMLPWMKFLASLIYKEKSLWMASESFEKFWVNTLDEEDLIELKEYLKELESIEPSETEGGDAPSSAPNDTPSDTTNTESTAVTTLPTDDSTTMNNVNLIDMDESEKIPVTTSVATASTTPTTASDAEPDVSLCSAISTGLNISHDNKADTTVGDTPELTA